MSCAPTGLKEQQKLVSLLEKQSKARDHTSLVKLNRNDLDVLVNFCKSTRSQNARIWKMCCLLETVLKRVERVVLLVDMIICYTGTVDSNCL